MGVQHHASRKRSLKGILENLPKLTIKDYTINSSYESQCIHFDIVVDSPNKYNSRVKFNLATFQTVETEKYGNLGAVSIELFLGFNYFSLGIPNNAFTINGDGYPSPVRQWNIRATDNLIYSAFENNTIIADFVKKIIAIIKEKHKYAVYRYKTDRLKYPPKANKELLEANKLVYELSMASALLETITCISNCYQRLEIIE